MQTKVPTKGKLPLYWAFTHVTIIWAFVIVKMYRTGTPFCMLLSLLKVRVIHYWAATGVLQLHYREKYRGIIIYYRADRRCRGKASPSTLTLPAYAALPLLAMLRASFYRRYATHVVTCTMREYQKLNSSFTTTGKNTCRSTAAIRCAIAAALILI